MSRPPLQRRPKGFTDAFDIPKFVPAASAIRFPIPPTIQSDYDRWLMTDVPNANYTFELVRDWYERAEPDYEPEYIRGIYFSINWKSKIGNSDANSNFRTHLHVNIRKGDLVIREDGSIYMLNWKIQRHINNQSTQAVDCNAYIDFQRDVDEVLDDKGFLIEPAGAMIVAPAIPCLYADFAGRPDYAPSFNTPGILADHLMVVQVQYNPHTKNIRINDKFIVMHSTYHVVHLMHSEVDIDNQYGIINILARKSAGGEQT